MKRKFIILNLEDNCATSLGNLSKGEEMQINGGKTIKINQEIPFGHKFALKDINNGKLTKAEELGYQDIAIWRYMAFPFPVV